MMWSYRHLTRMVNANSAYGIADLYDLCEKLGPVPEGEPGAQIDSQFYAARAVTDLYLDDPQNSVSVMWLCEPDSSPHKFGLGSPESQAGMKAVDDAVGYILAEVKRRGIRDQFDIIIFLSDHGHSTVEAHNTQREYLRLSKEEIGSSLPFFVIVSDYIYSQPGTKSELPTGAVDLMPTIMTLLNISLPEHLDGRVLWEILRNPQGEPGERRSKKVEPVVPANRRICQLEVVQVGQTNICSWADHSIRIRV